MTTLRSYLEQEKGRFSSLDHPVPVTGKEMIRALGDGIASLPGKANYDLDVFEMEIDVRDQPGGDRWIYLADRGALGEEGPFLMHHPGA